MKNIIVGTAGHIDHGKTLLIKALTGVDTDRLKEEKERGITIDIGFANLKLEDKLHIGFIDVPGHEKFVKNMLAGVAGIDMILLVIAADESIKPQTIEHFDICKLLNVKSGFVALTKIDLVDEEIIQLVTSEVREFLKGSFMEQSPIVPVSSKTGKGLEEVKRHLYQQGMTICQKETEGIFRMPIDRSFSVKGFGTVVTGTIISGSVSMGDDLEILPSGHHCKVRRIEIHSQTKKTATAGQRTALNLANVSYHDVRRGDTISRTGMMRPVRMIGARLTLLPSASPINDLMKVRFHYGTSEIIARIKMISEKKLMPGQSCYVQFRMDKPVVVFPQDRFIVRSLSPIMTIGGGVILDNWCKKYKISHSDILKQMTLLEKGEQKERIKLLLSTYREGGASLEELMKRTGLARDPMNKILKDLSKNGEVISIPGEKTLYLLHGSFHDLKEKIESELQKFHQEHPISIGIAKEELRRKMSKKMNSFLFDRLLNDLQKLGKIKIDKAFIQHARHEIKLGEKEQQIRDYLNETFKKAGLNPPDKRAIFSQEDFPKDLTEKIFQLLLKQGLLIKIKKELFIHQEAMKALTEKLIQYARKKSIISVAEFKSLTGLTRKNAIPLLEYLDQIKVTKREGNNRRILKESCTE